MAAKRKAAGNKTAVYPLRFMPDIAALTAVLQAHALGEHEMSASQVNVALSLLKIFAPQQQMAEETAASASHEDALQALA